MPLSKGSAKLQHFFLIRKFICGLFDVFCRKSNFYTYLFAHVRKNNYLCRGFDNCTLQNNTINPIFI